VAKPKVTKAQNARQMNSNIKSMIITLFDIKGIVQKEFVAKGKTVNFGFY
jgi:hypothetical protein